MHTHNHAVVWVDHCMAKIFSLGLTEVDSVTIHAHLPTAHLHHTANEVRSGKMHDDPSFFRRIAETLRNSKAVLLLGPGIEKTALMIHLASGGQSQSFDSLQEYLRGICRIMSGYGMDVCLRQEAKSRVAFLI